MACVSIVVSGHERYGTITEPSGAESLVRELIGRELTHDLQLVP